MSKKKRRKQNLIVKGPSKQYTPVDKLRKRTIEKDFETERFEILRIIRERGHIFGIVPLLSGMFFVIIFIMDGILNPSEWTLNASRLTDLNAIWLGFLGLTIFFSGLIFLSSE
jgi:hypothetical protein